VFGVLGTVGVVFGAGVEGTVGTVGVGAAGTAGDVVVAAGLGFGAGFVALPRPGLLGAVGAAGTDGAVGATGAGFLGVLGAGLVCPFALPCGGGAFGADGFGTGLVGFVLGCDGAGVWAAPPCVDWNCASAFATACFVASLEGGFVAAGAGFGVGFDVDGVGGGGLLGGFTPRPPTPLACVPGFGLPAAVVGRAPVPVDPPVDTLGSGTTMPPVVAAALSEFPSSGFAFPPPPDFDDAVFVAVPKVSAGTLVGCADENFGTHENVSPWPVACSQRNTEAARPAPKAPRLSPKVIRPPTKGQEYDRLSLRSIKHS